MGELREGAKVTMADGSTSMWELSPDIPATPGQGQMIVDVLKLALQGDIASIEVAEYELLDTQPVIS